MARVHDDRLARGINLDELAFAAEDDLRGFGERQISCGINCDRTLKHRGSCDHFGHRRSSYPRDTLAYRRSTT